MSRAMNLSLSESEVKAICLASGIDISAIEPLPAGDTHLVCTTGPGAEAIRTRLAGHLIDGKVTRYRFYRAPGA